MSLLVTLPSTSSKMSPYLTIALHHHNSLLVIIARIFSQLVKIVKMKGESGLDL